MKIESGKYVPERIENTADYFRVGMVVNYYCSTDSEQKRDLLLSTTALGIKLLRLNHRVGTIVVVDGSPDSDEELERLCEKSSAKYLHEGRELSIPEAYNIGLRSLTERYIGLMANDILPYPIDTVSRLLDMLANPGVGCVFPYMGSARMYSDETQQRGFLGRVTRSCEPASMTLNLLIFRRHALEEIGGLDENYVFGYQEAMLIWKFRSIGWRVVMVANTHVFHLDRLTQDIGASALTHAKHDGDSTLWFEQYPLLADERGLANMANWQWPYSTTRLVALLWWFCSRIPWGNLRKKFISYAIWLEPYLTGFPAHRGADEKGKSSEKQNLPDGICLEMKTVDPDCLTGFYDVEKLGDQHFRWAMPKAQIRFRLAPGDYCVVLDLKCLNGFWSGGFCAHLDDICVTQKGYEIVGEQVLFVLSESDFSNTQTHVLKLEVNAVDTSNWATPDNRSLGIPIYAIWIMPMQDCDPEYRR